MLPEGEVTIDNTELIRHQMNHLVTQARYDISMLANLNDPAMKQVTLQRLWDSISSIHFLSELLANQLLMSNKQDFSNQQPPLVNNRNSNQQVMPAVPISPNPSIPQPNERLFSIEELAKYDGKEGRPAYVAVEGIIYDVTNNRTWAAATHFGLVAGKNHSQEFASCHAGQQSILQTLPVVGRLV